MLAFAILEDIDFDDTISLLNKFLKKRIIHYYSIQVDTSEKFDKFIVVNFEHSEKKELIKAFHLVRQEFIDSTISAKFLKNQRLE